MKSLGYSGCVFGICMAAAILAGCGASIATVPSASQPDEAAHFSSRVPTLPLSRSHYAETVLFNFRGSTGANPETGLVLDENGALYGTTSGGGHADGNVFKLTPAGSGYTESFLYGFRGSRGAGPTGVILGKDGALYGTTVGGGRYNEGTAFKLTPSSSGYTVSVMHSFCARRKCADGAAPSGGLVFGKDGALYGTTGIGGNACLSEGGCGTVFKLTPSGSGYTEKVLYTFCQSTCAFSNPTSSLVFGADGALYGSTDDDCQLMGRCGTVYKLTPSGSGYSASALYTFECGTNAPINHRVKGPSEKPSRDNSGAECVGAFPSGVILDKTGALYGTTFEGGQYARRYQPGPGTVFKLTPSGSGYTQSFLHSFTGGKDGGTPEGGVILGKGGVLYGTTGGGGKACGGVPGCHDGTVFELTPSGSGYAERIIHQFDGRNGANPAAGLISDTTGALYSTTLDGGPIVKARCSS
ncbi:MAG TPA: choice-of-anchor tandem repeat GloVer-containing protein [Candidatus Cybelea sp.]